MKCRRAFDADLVAVLRGEGDDGDFLAHHATCPDCAAEVQVWRELDALLRADGHAGAAHPEPETLLAFVDAPEGLAAEARHEVERHLAACRVCVDEVRTLGGAAPAMFADVAVAPVAPRAAAASVAAAPMAASPTPGPTSTGGWLGTIVWHPAFAYALVAVLLVPLLRDQLGRVSVTARVMDARHEERRQAPESAVRAPAPAPPPAQSADAEQATANLADRADRADQVDGGTALASAKRETAAPGSGAAVPARTVDTSVRKDAAPAAGKMAPAAGKMAPAPMQAPEIDGQLARQKRAPQPEREAAAEPKAADQLAARPGSQDPPLAIGGAGGDRAVANAAGDGAPPGPPTVEVRSGMAATLPFALVASGALLRVTPPADLAPGALDIHVRSRVGGHELATRVLDHAKAIVVRIPPGWLAPGDYVMTLTPVQETPGATANGAVMLGFAVRAQTSVEAGR